MSKETVNVVAMPSATELEPSLTMSRRLQVGYYEGEGIEGTALL